MIEGPSTYLSTVSRVRIGVLLMVCVCLVAVFLMARKVEIRKVSTDEHWLSEENRVLVESVDELETLWRSAVEDAAVLELKARELERGEVAKKVVGVQQVSYFDGKRAEHKVIEFPLREIEPLKPTLKQIDDLLVKEDGKKMTGGQWVNKPGLPLLYVSRMNERKAVAFLLNPSAAREVALKEVREQLGKWPLNIPPKGYREIRDVNGQIVLTGGDDDYSAEPADEVIRHYSIFGEWTIRYWRPRETVVTYNTTLLTSGCLMSLLILSGGWWMAREQERAMKLAEDRVSFVNAVSHELRTPLTNILLAADLVQERVDDEQVKRRVDLIREESHRLARMVDNVLNFARAEKGKLNSKEKSGVDLRPLRRLSR